MTIKKLLELLPKCDRLKQMLSGAARVYLEICAVLNPYISKAADSAPVQFIARHKGHISLGLYILWLAGCGYWVYQLIIIDVKPGVGWDLGINDSREALVYLFFGLLGSIFVLFFVLFTLKLVFNLFQDGFESIFPDQWHSVAKSTIYLLILFCAFSYTGSIKAAGLTAYNQIAEIVNTSKNQNVVLKKEVTVDDLEKKLNALMKMMEEERQSR